MFEYQPANLTRGAAFPTLHSLRRDDLRRRRGVGCAAGEWIRPASFRLWADGSG